MEEAHPVFSRPAAEGRSEGGGLEKKKKKNKRAGQQAAIDSPAPALSHTHIHTHFTKGLLACERQSERERAHEGTGLIKFMRNEGEKEKSSVTSD